MVYFFYNSTTSYNSNFTKLLGAETKKGGIYMAQLVTTMTNYKTIEYRDKVEKEQEAAKNRLLEILPPYVNEYIKHKEPRLAIKSRREYLQDLNSFFSFLHEENPVLARNPMREIPLDALSSLSLNDFSEYERWLMNEKKGGGYNSPRTI